MKYKNLLAEGERILKENNLDTRDASALMKYKLGLTEIDKQNNSVISKKNIKEYENGINRLIQGQPIQYIIGHVSFYGYQFHISPDALIPRFETEELVNHTVTHIRKLFKEPVSVFDVGTGSGVIGITIKKEVPNANVLLSDISKKALKIAKKNANKLGVKVNFKNTDMLEGINDYYDVIISNPPYIIPNNQVEPIVRNNEPHIALYGGEDGLKYYKSMLEEAHKILKEKSLIAFEIDEPILNGILLLVKQHFPMSHYDVKKDMQGRKRMLFIFNGFD
jgi:release factor glutamine methyltransferase